MTNELCQNKNSIYFQKFLGEFWKRSKVSQHIFSLFQEKNYHIGIRQLIHKMNQICQIRLDHGTDFLPTWIFFWVKTSPENDK
jgi:hypothetical protein